MAREASASDNNTLWGMAGSRSRFDLVVVGVFAALVLGVAVRFDLHERAIALLSPLERWNVDELIVVAAMLSLALTYFSSRRWHETALFNRELRRANAALRAAVEEVRTLRGIVPICASCKRVRDDEGYWHQVEKYVAKHTLAEFSHGLCVECARKLYPEYFGGEGNDRPGGGGPASSGETMG